ncbi:MAG: diaminopimelate decarboxylase [Oligoflexia bacterium]|nr:diaminopimelate decarboxylase [Oligoflexia bacterium]
MYLTLRELLTHPFFATSGIEKVKPFLQNYKSPLYLYSREVITKQYNSFKEQIPNQFKIFYAQKSNPNEVLLQHILHLGAGCDTASLGEMNAALKVGFKSEEIMLTGPGKSEDELAFAIEKGILSINVESFQELEMIEQISARLQKRQNILVRINPPFDACEKTRIIGGSGVSKFGIDLEQVSDFIKRARRLKHVCLNGIHIFNSSQILEGEKILQNTIEVIKTAMRFQKIHHLQVKRIDLGGGLGIPYSTEESPLNLQALGSGLRNYLEGSEAKQFLRGVDLVFELGRFLSGLSGIYLTKVLYTKTSRGTNIVITDGGINHLLRPVLIEHKHPMVNLTAILEGRTEVDRYLVAGPLCTSLDEFDDEAKLLKVLPGDILAIVNAGAYGFTESMPYFLSQTKVREEFLPLD